MISGNHLLYSKLMMYLFSLFACKHLWQMTGPPSVQYVCNEVCCCGSREPLLFYLHEQFCHLVITSPFYDKTLKLFFWIGGQLPPPYRQTCNTSGRGNWNI